MPVDPTKFFKINVADTCSVWNLISSQLLFSTACNNGCRFSMTQFVEYECFYKPRKSETDEELELIDRAKHAQVHGQLEVFPIDIEDLQEVKLLENRKNLSKGELSSIAFAKKIDQAFITDDQGARKLAEAVMADSKVQTTPHLVGWLVYDSIIGDIDVCIIIKQHEEMKRPLARYFKEIHIKALERRLADG